MYIITCMKDGEEYKLIKDDTIGCDWGKSVFDAKVFETKEDAVNFIINEPKFTKINEEDNRLPFLLSEIDVESVYIKKVEEIRYKNISNIKFDKVLKKLK